MLAFRFFNVFGPLQAAGHAYAAVVPAFVDAALAGRPLTVHGDGEQTRDFTYVGTVCDVIADAVAPAGHPRHRRSTWPSAPGPRCSSWSPSSKSVLGRAARASSTSSPARGDVRDSQADNTLLRSLFPGTQPVPLRAGLEETVRWFRER